MGPPQSRSSAASTTASADNRVRIAGTKRKTLSRAGSATCGKTMAIPPATVAHVHALRRNASASHNSATTITEPNSPYGSETTAKPTASVASIASNGRSSRRVSIHALNTIVAARTTSQSTDAVRYGRAPNGTNASSAYPGNGAGTATPGGACASPNGIGTRSHV